MATYVLIHGAGAGRIAGTVVGGHRARLPRPVRPGGRRRPRPLPGPGRGVPGARPRDDRFFPAEFQRRVVRDRLGITPDEMGGHLPARARPAELVGHMEAYRAGL